MTPPVDARGMPAPPAAAPAADDPLWYRDAVIYQLHVKAFRDSNGDGIGDFAGLTQSLDYIKDLGVDAIWLLPFYPSPLRDDGYDIADYHGVHPHYGTRADFRHFLREAHRRSLRVITELVINHTSDEHPWFQAARAAPADSSKRNYYVWSDTDTKWPETRIIFTDTEKSNWAWDPVAKAYYWHRFFSHQPDLNFDNPSVVRAVMRVMRFWFDMGVDGMRLDAIPYLCERDGTNNENLPETHAVLKRIRRELDKHYRDKFFLAEVNQWPEDVREYFGDGDECHMAFHFPLMPRIYMAVAEEDRFPIVDIMAQTPDIPENCQWAIFLRNHDELTLEMVTERERDYMYRTYASDRRMRINVGIRRRLAPLMDNDRRKIELVNSLLMSLIGSPVIYYGDEIGMGDNIYLGDRNGVRTPMQWSPDRNAGFSRADPQLLYSPPIMDPIYGYSACNVEAQSRTPGSLLNWMKRLIAVRRAHPAFGRGTLRFVRPGNRKILAYLREYRGEIILCVANLARSSQPVELHLSEFKTRIPVELIGNTGFPPIGELPYLLTLPPWGFYWFALTTDAKYPRWHSERPMPAELPALVIPEGLMATLMHKESASHDMRSLMARRVREQLERDVLPVFLAGQRWFAGKGAGIRSAVLIERDDWGTDAGKWLLAIVLVTLANGQRQLYSLPLALAWEDREFERIQSLLPCTVARVRQRARVGVLYDAFWDDGFCRALVASMGRNEKRAVPGGVLVFSSTQQYSRLVSGDTLSVRHPTFEQSNTLVILGERLVLKAYRRLHEGVNPEIEIGRFLTDASPYRHIAPTVGALEYRDSSGEVTALALVQGFVDNRGSGWDYTLEHLGRFLDAIRTQQTVEITQNGVAQASGEVRANPATPTHAGYLTLIEKLGRRTAELHQALAKPTGDRAFEPEPLTADDLSAWHAKVRDDVVATLDLLAQRQRALPENLRADANRLLVSRDALLARVDSVAPAAVNATKTRYHGDYHLGQVLLTTDDFVIVDFEGEPARSLAERRAKHSPLRDVAGMLRSFSYAAAVALDRATSERPDDRPRLVGPLNDWRTQTMAAFHRAYVNTIRGTSTYPDDDRIAGQLIQLFALEKVLYELRYELANRPDWVRIPLAGLLEQLVTNNA
ncbi:MAG TPA: maltose alpha-D-glucosyltransferase [Casimicrobiaceae bacterium]|nr:maltose alpha-D-glucosyltransferase [Casimicrobiaceae bacterium]